MGLEYEIYISKGVGGIHMKQKKEQYGTSGIATPS
jgi:hypothetical protein